MDSEFTAAEGRRLVEIMLQAMTEGWLPGSEDASDGAWTDKQAETRFRAAFKELAERDPELRKRGE